VRSPISLPLRSSARTIFMIVVAQVVNLRK